MPAGRRERWLHAVPDAPPAPASPAADMARAGAGPRDTGPVGRASADGAQEAEVDPEADPEAVARLICLRMLTVAPRTRAQLGQALRKRGVPESAAEAVLSRFAEVGLIDDAMFARAWVESRHVGRGLARRALASELGQRGVAKDHIDAAIGLLTPDAELATARELVERKLAGTRGQPPAARIRRLAGMLARKGYPAGLAYRVVREALEREGADEATLGLLPDEPEDASAGFEE